jgi:hypothetical protein
MLGALAPNPSVVSDDVEMEACQAWFVEAKKRRIPSHCGSPCAGRNKDEA